MSLSEVALSCIARGWYVFPCWPRSKKPMTKHGWHDASNDEAKIREWWTSKPDANVAIACNPSGLCVVDIDHGLKDETDLSEFWAAVEYGDETYAVRTGRRPEFGVQLYFAGVVPDVGLWKAHGCEGQVKSAGGYVMAAGSIHPDSGLAYEVLSATSFPDEYAVLPTPEWVRSLRSHSERVSTEPGKKVAAGAGRHDALMRIACSMRSRGLDADTIYEAMLPINPAVCEVPIPDDDLRAMCDGIARRYAAAEDEPVVTIGGKALTEGARASEPVDWRTRYMTQDAYLNVRPPEFLIDRFLVRKSIVMLAGPVAQRKSIIALNIAHALCTGEPLFGYFEVTSLPERVVYLCPEMGASSFAKRIKSIGLGEHIGKTLFLQTMSEKPTTLDDLDGELPGAVVIVDTIVRFVEGDENNSADMREFARKVFRLMNAGATVILLHHSKKGSSGSLDDGLRGSSELAAFVDSCWTTELEDPKKPYESLSKLRNVKQRDFECDPCKLKPTADSYYLTMSGEPGPEAVLKSKADEAATAALRELVAGDPKMGVNKLCSALRTRGHGRGAKWVMAARAAMLGTGSIMAE